MLRFVLIRAVMFQAHVPLFKFMLNLKGCGFHESVSRYWVHMGSHGFTRSLIDHGKLMADPPAATKIWKMYERRLVIP